MKPEHKILFTGVPKLGELKYFVGIIDFSEKLNNMSNFTLQKIETRRLIETHPDILAAPVDRKISHVHLIFPGNFTNGEIRNFVNQTKLTLSGQSSLQKEIYLDCILFTLTVRLSPEWNKMGKYFIKGNFLCAPEASEAVRLQLLLTDGCLAFSTWPLKLKLPSANPIDFEVDLKGLFKEGLTIVRRKVFVLPDLKLGIAVCIYAKLPPSCPFRSYDQIKTHWKKLYGYNLPSSEEGMTYIEVTFNSSGFSYLYPVVCICPYEPIHFRTTNELKVIDEFSKVITKKFSKLCRHPIGLDIKDDVVFRPVSRLHLASEVIDKPNLLSLLSDEKVLEDFKNENPAKCHLKMPCNKAEKRGQSPPLFLPSFGQITPKPRNETFKCFPVFTPKVKARFAPKNPSKKLKSSDVELHDKIKYLAGAKNLRKMSLPTLLKFCSDNGIPIKKKEKKETVLEKIYNYFNLFIP